MIWDWLIHCRQEIHVCSDSWLLHTGLSRPVDAEIEKIFREALHEVYSWAAVGQLANAQWSACLGARTNTVHPCTSHLYFFKLHALNETNELHLTKRESCKQVFMLKKNFKADKFWNILLQIFKFLIRNRTQTEQLSLFLYRFISVSDLISTLSYFSPFDRKKNLYNGASVLKVKWSKVINSAYGFNSLRSFTLVFVHARFRSTAYISLWIKALSFWERFCTLNNKHWSS